MNKCLPWQIRGDCADWRKLPREQDHKLENAKTSDSENGAD
jgi:hypothetical protein